MIRGSTSGRWPANVCHDGSPEVLAGFPETGKGSVSGYNLESSNNGNPTHITHNIKSGVHFGDSGSAARFFYCSKASKSDRDEGCDALPAKQYSHDGRETPIENAYQRNESAARNHHATVKPTALMAWLCRLVTPPGGLILDPFCGSGSTGKAAMREGFRFVGIERESDYVDIANARIAHEMKRETERKIEVDRQTLLPFEGGAK